MDLYSIGEMVIDFIPGSEKGSYIRNAGGAPANVAIAVVRNGLTSGMCCSVGEDDFGRFLQATLEENQVKVLNPILCAEAITTMAFVNLDEHGERSFTFARKPGADMFLDPSQVKEEDIKDSVIVHAGSCSMSAQPALDATTKALQLGHEYGKLVSYDINYRNLMWKDDIDACTEAVKKILPYVDLLKISDEEVDMLGGEGNIDAVMKEYGITVVIETLGSKGAKAFFNGTTFVVPGILQEVVDTTGAGDAFWGGFLSSLRIQGMEASGQITEEVLKNAMLYGNASGSTCCHHKGAIVSLPTRKEIEDLIREKGVK